jgi:hypothetical protein
MCATLSETSHVPDHVASGKLCKKDKCIPKDGQEIEIVTKL